MERRKLSETEIAEKLITLHGWTADDGRLRRRFDFSNFAKSLVFVNKAAELAEKADHHPDISFGWGYAEFLLTTHDRGGITDFDFELARNIDGIE
ncbi:MAG: 4a-hydroxytetrahydrobiopterin dehydratase [Pyrinomonadaceae bacterium]